MNKPPLFAGGEQPALEEILDALPAAICLRDAKTMQIRGWNTAAEKLSGQKRQDLLGRCTSELLTRNQLKWLRVPEGEEEGTLYEGLFQDAQEDIRPLRINHSTISTTAQSWLVTSAIDIVETRENRLQLIDFVQRVLLGDYEARLDRDHSGSYADTIAELLNMICEELSSQLSELNAELQQARDAAVDSGARPRTNRPAATAYDDGTLDALACGVFVCDQQGQVMAANQVLLELLGLQRQDVIESSWPLFFWEQCPVVPANLVGRHEGTLIRADGSKLTAELIAKTAADPPRTIVTVRDITKDNAIRQQLYISERQATIGTLASGVAHEINNPLMYISGNLEIAMEAIKDGESPADMLEMLQDAYYGAKLIKQIVHDLRVWTQAKADKLSHVNLQALLKSCLAMARPVLKHRASTQLDVPEGLSVPGYEARLAQLFLNLVVNAAQAIGEGNVAHNLVRVRAEKKGQHVVVVVSDTGCGMRSDEVEHMFEPFFTTKGESGIGLGLALVANIVEAHNGTIDVSSTIDKGTEISVSLPLRSLKPIGPASLSGAGPIADELSILLIDDDALVADTLRRSLSHHHVTTFADAGNALAVLNGEAQDFDVVLCDVMMPMMSGIEFFQRLKKSNPRHAERVIFVTGGGLDHADTKRLEACQRPLLWKPIGVNALRRAVATMVSHDASGVGTSPPQPE